jgi:hypothetical protein
MPVPEKIGFWAFRRKAMRESLTKTKAISNFAKVICGGIAAIIVYLTLIILSPGADSRAKLLSAGLSVITAGVAMVLYSLVEWTYYILMYPIEEANKAAGNASQQEEKIKKLETEYATERAQLQGELSAIRAEQAKKECERPRLVFIEKPTPHRYGDQWRFEITLKNDSTLATTGVNVQAVSIVPAGLFPNATLPEILDTHSKSDNGTVKLRAGEVCTFRVVSWTEHGHVSLCAARDGLTSAKFDRSANSQFELELKAYGDGNTVSASIRLKFFWNGKEQNWNQLKAEIVSN